MIVPNIYSFEFMFFLGINIDFETDELESPPKEVIHKYSEIMTLAEQGFLKVISMETIKEHYEVPKITVDGKEWVTSCLRHMKNLWIIYIQCILFKKKDCMSTLESDTGQMMLHGNIGYTK